MKINKLNESMIPSQEILDDCLDDYLNNAFGYNGVEDYVATQYPNHPSEWQARICDYLKQHKHESLNLNEDVDHPFMFQYNCNNSTFGYDFQRYAQELGARRMYDHTQRGGGLHFYTVPSEDVYNKLKEVAKKRFTVDMFPLRPFDKERYGNAKVQEAYEFSDDDFEDDQMHAAVYGGDSKYCKDCGAVKVYDEDGFAYCPKCNESLREAKVFGAKVNKLNEDTFNDYDEDDEGKMVGISFDVSVPSNMKESEIETIIRKAIGATDLDIPGHMEIHILEESLTEDNKLLPIEVLNPDGTPKQYDVKFMELEKVPGLLNWDVADQLEQHFRNNNLRFYELHYNEVKDCIEYDISWGDWKHEHLRSKLLIEELFENLKIVAHINSYTTEEDGSDNYSAHYIVRAMGKMNEAITPPTGDDPDLSAIPQIGQEVMYRGKRTTIIDYEQDPEYGYDFLIKNPFWNGEDERFENIWVGDQVDFIDWGPDDIGLQPPG